MIRIALVEDETIEQERVKGFINDFEEKYKVKILLNIFDNGSKFLFDFEYSKYDIILMDIELGKNENGIEISKKIREIDEDVFLVFMTSLIQYAIDGYKVNAIDYLVKPYSFEDFSTRLYGIVDKVKNSHSEKVLIQTNGAKIVIAVKDIVYVEVSNHQLIFHTTSRGNIQTYGSLKDAYNELGKHNFSMCNSYLLVNLDYVENIDGYNVKVNGIDLLISHPKRKNFLKELNLFLGK